jgi:hypothetical protein
MASFLTSGAGVGGGRGARGSALGLGAVVAQLERRRIAVRAERCGLGFMICLFWEVSGGRKRLSGRKGEFHRQLFPTRIPFTSPMW